MSESLSTEFSDSRLFHAIAFVVLATLAIVSKAARIRASGHPQADEFADGNVLQSPSEEDMLQMLEPANESSP